MISTHVLDTELGQPGAGIEVGLFHGDELVARQVTDPDGRISDLSGGQSLGPGRYRLVFFVRRAFFGWVGVTIELEADRHYHVPLLLAPYQCTIYRGS
jgi:5-hydroxyisourate hydrolase